MPLAIPRPGKIVCVGLNYKAHVEEGVYDLHAYPALFPKFASRLIRNGATLGGNLGTGSPIGDLAPALLALDAAVVLVSARGERALPLAAVEGVAISGCK